MARMCMFLRNDEGSITINAMEIAAGILTLGIMATYAILNDGTAHRTVDLSDAVAWVNTELDTGTAPQLTGAGAFQLTERVSLPVGSVAVHSDVSFTSFEAPDGGWIDAWSRDGNIVPEGARLTSPDTFMLQDGSTVAASTFSLSYSEVYSSKVAYSFSEPLPAGAGSIAFGM
jgi:hypothetical protein